MASCLLGEGAVGGVSCLLGPVGDPCPAAVGSVGLGTDRVGPVADPGTLGVEPCPGCLAIGPGVLGVGPGGLGVGPGGLGFDAGPGVPPCLA